MENFIQLKDEIYKEWLSAVISSFSQQTSQFLKNQDNPFENPVGSALKNCLWTIVEYIAEQASEADLEGHLDNLIRIRSVQDTSPSEALSFMYTLKDILSQKLHSSDEVILLYKQIDDISLKAFDLYMACREQLFSLRSREMKRTMFRTFESRGGSQ